MNVSRMLTLIFPLFFLFACGEGKSPAMSTVSESGQPAQKVQETPAPVKRVALVMKTLTNPFFIEMERGARRAEKEQGIELLVKTAAQETSIEQQIQIVVDLILARVDAIIIAPGDSHRLVPVLKKAMDKGIQIVNLDNKLNRDTLKQLGVKPIPFISVDNETAAYQSAKYIADSVSVPTQAAILEGIRSADNARLRMEGAKRAFTENSLIELVASESANWKIDEGYLVTKQIFSNFPEVKLIFAANDMMALGTLKYLQESGRNDVKVSAYDALSEAVAEVKAGRLAATVDQHAAEQGYQGVLMAMRLLAGENVPELMMIDTRLITAAR